MCYLETLYHLTPNGWVEGEERYGGEIQRETVALMIA